MSDFDDLLQEVAALRREVSELKFALRNTVRTGTVEERDATKGYRLNLGKDDQGKMNLSVRDIGGAALVVSQFTLAADLRGNRPGFSTAAAPTEGERLYRHFSQALEKEGVPVANGRFGADMAVSLVNDGPVTTWMDTDQS